MMGRRVGYNCLASIMGVLALCGLPLSAAAQDPPPRQVMTYAFTCAGLDISLSLAMTFARERQGTGWRTSLQDLQVNGSAVELSPSLQAEISSFATIESVTPHCSEDQADIVLKGLNLSAWNAFITEDTDRRPDPQFKVIIIPRKGAVRTTD